MDFKFFSDLLFALLIGLLLGIERERARRAKPLGGVRTFTMLSLLGFITYHISSIYPFSFYIMFSSITLIALFSYIKYGAMTTLVAFIMTYILGFLVSINLNASLVISIIVLILLSFKRKIHKIVLGIKEEEWLDFMKFAIFAFLLYPLIPEGKIVGIINLKKVWKFVILISILNFAGYVTTKLFGKKGMFFSGIFGGLSSSTAIAFSVSTIAKEKDISLIGASTIVAAISMMFLRLLVIFFFASIRISIKIAPFLISSSVIGLTTSYIMFRISKEEEISMERKPFAIEDALKFGIIFAVVLLISENAEKFFGKSGLYVISFLSGITNVDAISLSLCSLFEEGKIGINTAILGIFLAATSNNIFKASIAFASRRKMGSLVFLSVFLMTLPFIFM